MPVYTVTATKRYAVSESRDILADSPEAAERIAREMIAEDEFFEFPDNLYFDGDLIFVTGEREVKHGRR